MKKTYRESFPDHRQNFWTLASIQSAAQSIPSIFLGGVIASKHGFMGALAAIFIGNLVLWLIGLAVISMTNKGKQNVIQSVTEYFGQAMKPLIAFVVMLAFIGWFMINLDSAIEGMQVILPSWKHFGLIGLSLGLFAALISVGGIRLIKVVALTALPLLVLFILYTLFSYGSFQHSAVWNVSFAAIMMVIIFDLPGIVNISTFFRHAATKAEAVLGLTLMMLFDFLFESSTAFLGIGTLFQLTHLGGQGFALCSLGFILVSFLCLSLVNIYFSAAGVEALLPRLRNRLVYPLIGIAGTLLYFYFRRLPLMQHTEAIATIWIANLGITLLISFLVKSFVKHRIRFREKAVSTVCWLISSMVGFVSLVVLNKELIESVLLSIWSVVISFIVVLFFEETRFYLKKLGAIPSFWNKRNR